MGEEREVKKKIGEGSFGLVSKVEIAHPDGGVLQYAKKLSKRRTESQTPISTDFLREVGILRLLAETEKNTERLVQLKFIKVTGDHGGNNVAAAIYIPLMENGSLYHFIKNQQSPIAVQMLVSMSRDVFSILEQLRSCSVLHRDLKPANVLVNAHGRLVLGDFGSAVLLNHRVRLTGRYCTTGYVRSPETIIGFKSLHYASDVWSAGCTLWFLLTGGKHMMPLLRSRVIRQQQYQTRYMVGQILQLLGTRVRVRKVKVIEKKYAALYHILRDTATLPGPRLVAKVFREKLDLAIHRHKVATMGKSTKRKACLMVCKLLWWFPPERLVVSLKSGWRERIRFFQPQEVVGNEKPVVHYPDVDISKVPLEVMDSRPMKKQAKQRRNRGSAKRRKRRKLNKQMFVNV